MYSELCVVVGRELHPRDGAQPETAHSNSAQIFSTPGGEEESLEVEGCAARRKCAVRAPDELVTKGKSLQGYLLD